MADEAVLAKPEMIDLTFKVNDEGMTGEDLLQMFLSELDKRGIYACGIMVRKKDVRVAQFYGLQARDYSGIMAIDVLKEALQKFDRSMIVSHKTLGTSNQPN